MPLWDIIALGFRLLGLMLPLNLTTLSSFTRRTPLLIMEYEILEVHVALMTNLQYRVWVTFRSNLPAYTFAWRCYTQTINHFPTAQDIQEIAAGGGGVDESTAKKLFPSLNRKAWEAS